MSYNTNFSWPFFQTIKVSIITKNNASFGRILGEQFKLDMMDPQRIKEAPKTPEGIPVSLLVAIPETQNNKEVRGNMGSMVELKKTVIYQRKIPGQH